MCPRFSSDDPQLDMSMQTYEKIHQAMGYAHTVDFTGWGEPLLHREIFRMVQMARAQGCLTTMTSNGTALNEKNGLKLMESGLDRLVISVDGVRPETYDPIRIGSSFEQLTQKISNLTRRIRERKSTLEVGVAFTIQKGNAGDLDLVLPWMQSVSVSVLHLKHLNVISTAGDWENSFLKYALPPVEDDPEPLRRLESAMEGLKQEAAKTGIRVSLHSEFPLTAAMAGRHCLATPLESVYFSFEGRVSPCCHFGHHVSRYFEGDFFPPSSLYFGDIRSQTLEEVWQSPPFLEFRRGFEIREFPEACRTCYLLYGK